MDQPPRKSITKSAIVKWRRDFFPSPPALRGRGGRSLWRVSQFHRPTLLCPASTEVLLRRGHCIPRVRAVVQVDNPPIVRHTALLQFQQQPPEIDPACPERQMAAHAALVDCAVRVGEVNMVDFPFK